MPTSNDEHGSEYRLLAIAAARWRSEGLTQGAIAKRLQKSQPEVSRLLAFAEDHGFLARSPSFFSHMVDPAELEEVDRRFFVHGALRAALQKQAPAGLTLSVRVLPAGEEAFALAAAEHISRLIRRSKAVGIMWGRTVQRLVAQIRLRPGLFGQESPPGMPCIPLCGDPLHLMNLRLVKYSASHLAAELGQVLNPGPSSEQPCLVGVPAYFSRRFFLQRNAATPGWEEFVRGIPGYRAIFETGHGGESPWCERVDTVLTGMGIVAGERSQADAGSPGTGSHEETGDFIRERLIQEEGLTEAQLARLIYGDLGGWLLERRGLSAADRRLVEELNQGWTGIQGARLTAVARNAKAAGSPGVIVLAAGPAKTEMILEIVRRGYVNELLVDTSLAASLRSGPAPAKAV